MIPYNCQPNDWMLISLQIWNNFYVISVQVLTKKKQNTNRVYQDSWPPPLGPQKVVANLNPTFKNI